MPNQYKPSPPLELVEPHIRRFHAQGISFDKMVPLLAKHYDTSIYGLGRTKLKTYAKTLGLPSARSQCHTFDTIAEPIAQLRKVYPTAGANTLRLYLRNNYDIYVSRDVIRRYLKCSEPDLVAERLRKRLVQHTLFASGVNHFWAMGWEDKWKRFGLYWHGCVDGFTGKILWLVVWWNNSNPKYVCAQYLKAVKELGGAPCVTQSDPGTENHNVAYAHTHIRHTLDPRLAGAIQHQWKRAHVNTEPGQMWRQFRRMWAPGFEALLEEGITEQWYNVDNIADRLVFRWIAVPWLQKMANTYAHGLNTTRRMNRRKVLPSGVPDFMFENPETVDAPDFKTTVPEALLEEAERRWAAPTDPVFELTPLDCDQHIASVYAQIGSPTIDFHSFWTVYNALRDAVDSDALCRATIDAPEGENVSGGADGLLPLHHLRPCQFGIDGIPAARNQNGQSEEKAELSVGCSDEESEVLLVVDFTDDEGDELF